MFKYALYAFIAVTLIHTSAWASDSKRPTQKELVAAYEAINKASKQTDGDVHRQEIIDFTYEVAYPEGGDCCDPHPSADLFIKAVDQPSGAKGFIVGVPDASGGYNTSYDVMAITKAEGKIKAWPLGDEYSFDPKTKTLVKGESLMMFPNLSFDKTMKAFKTTVLGNSMGWCTTTSYYNFNGDELELIKITQTDDCDMSMDQVKDRPKTTTLYEKKSDFSKTTTVNEKRCGWFVNPTPGNAWLHDKDAEWIIGAQGGHQAEGDWPEFEDRDWVKTNVHYGYGCACLDVETDKKAEKITNILSAKSMPLANCRNGKAPPEPERP
jgi:hypothetical protein